MEDFNFLLSVTLIFDVSANRSMDSNWFIKKKHFKLDFLSSMKRFIAFHFITQFTNNNFLIKF